MSKALIEFDLQLGEQKKFTGKKGETYSISATLFSEHDHRSKPLYYYHPEKISENDPKQVVLCVEDDLEDANYTSPYSGTIEGTFDVFRKDYIFGCDLTADRIVHVRVCERSDDREVYSSKNRKITWPFGS